MNSAFRGKVRSVVSRTPLLEDNMRRWSGDHIVDPESVPGILFMNRATRKNQPAIIDLAPTILSYLGVAVPDSLEGLSLL